MSTSAMFSNNRRLDDVTDWNEARKVFKFATQGNLHAMRSRASDVLDKLTDQRLREECRRIIAEINSEIEARYEVELVKKVVR